MILGDCFVFSAFGALLKPNHFIREPDASSMLLPLLREAVEVFIPLNEQLIVDSPAQTNVRRGINSPQRRGIFE